MKSTLLAALAAIGLATAVLAHQGVQNPAVLKRMDAMSDMGDAVAVVGRMVKGETDFDAARIARAVERLRARAAETPDLFEARESDPRMEALPELWDNWSDFLERNAAMEDALAAPAPKSETEARRWLASIGRACAACHEDYRE